MGEQLTMKRLDERITAVSQRVFDLADELEKHREMLHNELRIELANGSGNDWHVTVSGQWDGLRVSASSYGKTREDAARKAVMECRQKIAQRRAPGMWLSERKWI